MTRARLKKMNIEKAASQADGQMETAAAPAKMLRVYSPARMMTSRITTCFMVKE